MDKNINSNIFREYDIRGVVGKNINEIFRKQSKQIISSVASSSVCFSASSACTSAGSRGVGSRRTCCGTAPIAASGADLFRTGLAPDR